MLTFMKIYAIEILSVIMGLWLLWIIVTYTNYFKKLKDSKSSNSVDPNKERVLQKARDKRKETYNVAVTYPSYAIFWAAVTVWGLSYLLKNNLTLE